MDEEWKRLMKEIDEDEPMPEVWFCFIGAVIFTAAAVLYLKYCL